MTGRAHRRAAAAPVPAAGAPASAPPTGGPRRRVGPRAAFTAVALAALAVLAAAAAAIVWALGPVDPNDARTVEFEVLPGSSARRVATELEEAGLLRDRRALLAVLAWRGDDGRVGEGLYDLGRDLSVAQVADALVRGGRPRTARFVLPEGIRAADVVRRVAAAGWPDETVAELAALIAEPPADLRPEGLPDGAGLEGYLFPASYELPVRFGAREIAGALLARFERELGDEVRASIAEFGLDVHGWVTLASMIQAEAGGDDEMGVISGVFANRLDIDMPLQSDPTVAYGLGKDLPELDFPGGDFDVDHPWNTYTRGGLPRGPIGNPGAAALAAVLAPVRHDERGRAWLYFLHGRDGGQPVFRPNVDFEGHLRDVARFLNR